jgi:hypothetical protein
MMYTAMLHEGPSAIRYPRGIGPGVAVKAQPVALEIGKAEVVQDGARMWRSSGWARCCRRRCGWRRCWSARIFGGGDQSAVCEADRPLECVAEYGGTAGCW